MTKVLTEIIRCAELVASYEVPGGDGAYELKCLLNTSDAEELTRESADAVMPDHFTISDTVSVVLVRQRGPSSLASIVAGPTSYVQLWQQAASNER